jgi:hypothetical protein
LRRRGVGIKVVEEEDDRPEPRNDQLWHEGQPTCS